MRRIGKIKSFKKGPNSPNDIVNKSEINEYRRKHGRWSNRQLGQGRKAHNARSEREQSKNDQINIRIIYCINVLDYISLKAVYDVMSKPK